MTGVDDCLILAYGYQKKKKNKVKAKLKIAFASYRFAHFISYIQRPISYSLKATGTSIVAPSKMLSI